MKQSQVKPGVQAMLSLGGRRGAVAVTVLSLRWRRPETWLVVDPNGKQHNATPRQLQPMPAPYLSAPSELAHYRRFAAAPFCGVAGCRGLRSGCDH
jgi:hypothetical protein